MAFEKGKSGNPGGRKSDKPFADALRMELAAAGDGHKALRAIARNLIALAQDPTKDAMPAINAIADRLDGKPAQESVVTIDDKRDATDWTRDELVAFLSNETAGSEGTVKAEGRGGKPDAMIEQVGSRRYVARFLMSKLNDANCDRFGVSKVELNRVREIADGPRL